MSFVVAALSEELWVGELRGVLLDERPVVLLRTEQGVFAYEDRCAHLGVPLSEGTLEGTVLTCHAHRFQYDALTGKGINPPSASLLSLPVREEGGRILVDASACKKRRSVG